MINMAMDDVYQITVAAKACGQWVNNVLRFQQTTTGGDDPYATATDLLNAYTTATQTAWLNLFATDYKLLGYRCKRIWPTGGPSYTSPTPGVAGSVEDTSAMTSAVGAVIVVPYSTNGGSKWRTGRIFLPAAPESFVDENALTLDYISAISAYAALLVDILEGFIASYQYGIFAQQPEKAFYDAEEYTISGGLGFQRHRAAPVLGKPSRSSHKRRVPAP